MKMPNGYNETQARTGAREQLAPGGYVCRIRGAKEETNGGYWQLAIAFDIHDGDKAGFFEQRYKDSMQANKDAKWPAAGTLRVFVMDYNNREQCSPEFKGLITSVEESNPGFVMQWGDGSERSLSLPTRGAWIEISTSAVKPDAARVAPHTGSVD